jgi:hypothetical protein
MRYRPFVSVEDFLTRPAPARGRKPAARWRVRRFQGGGWQAGQMSLFTWNDVEGQDWTVEQKMVTQLELLGISLEAHPLELAAEKIAASGSITTLEAARIGKRVTIAGIRQTSHRSRIAKDESMMFLTLENLSGVLDVVLFPDASRQGKNIVSSAGPFPNAESGLYYESLQVFHFNHSTSLP